MDKRDIVLISLGNSTIIGLYKKSSNSEHPLLESYAHVNGMVSHTLPFLFGIIFNRSVSLDSNTLQIESTSLGFSNTLHDLIESIGYTKGINSINYARGVGSLSAIKLTHVFLHSISISMDIPLFAKNSFYFTNSKEIFAFGSMSFFLNSKDSLITDERACDYISLSKSINPSNDFVLPKILIQSDFNETCTPLYITPPL